ncbi:MAG: hypothetical protein HQM09_15135 [Candidatus Riflebacteria bacterium]|nr:hypothetical protein [Candidatus Riflebacteria bacterium]
MQLSEIFALEPKAKHLWSEALSIGMTNPSFDNEDIFRRQFKKRLVALVGFDSPETSPAAIRTTEAYDVLYRAVLDALHCWEKFQNLRTIATTKGYKQGWPAIQFKIAFGVMPRFPFKKRSPYEIGAAL